MKKIFVIMVIMLFILGCGKDDAKPKDTASVDAESLECPSSCDDKDKCTQDFCSEDTDYECRHKPITPCCGNSVCEEEEDYKTCSSDCQAPKLPAEIASLIAKTANIKSYSYDYYYKALGVKIFVKGDKVKHFIAYKNMRPPELNRDTIYFDLAKKKAWEYCLDLANCNIDNKLYPVSFDKYWIETPMQKLEKVTTAKIVGEEMKFGRKAILIEYTNEDGNREVLGLDNYYGIPLFARVYEGENEWKLDYDNMALNSVSSAEVEFPPDARED